MNPWIRLYRDSLHNPKIVSLSDRQHRVWHNCLCMANDAGDLPRIRDMACHLRMSVQETEQVLCELVEHELIDIEGTGPARTFRMHDWRTHQYVSDSSTERVRKFRNKNKETKPEAQMKRFSNSDVTSPDTDTDTDTDTEKDSYQPARTEQAAASGPPEVDGLNGSTKMIVEQFASWLNPWNPDLQTAHRSIADAVSLYGPQAVRDGFADLKADHADGKVRVLTVKAFYGFVRTAKDGRKPKAANLSAAERKGEQSRALLAEIDAQIAAGGTH